MKFITLSILLFIVSHPFNNDVEFIHPVKDTAQIVTDFGNCSHPILHEVKHHNGIDYKVEVGTEVWASASGIITDLGLKGSLGKTVTIDHGNGFVSIYAQLSSINELLVGDLVGDEVFDSTSSWILENIILQKVAPKSSLQREKCQLTKTNK